MSRENYHLLLIVALAAALAYMAWQLRGEIDFLAETIRDRTGATNGRVPDPEGAA